MTDHLEHLVELERLAKPQQCMVRQLLCRTLSGNRCDLLTITSFIREDLEDYPILDRVRRPFRIPLVYVLRRGGLHNNLFSKSKSGLVLSRLLFPYISSHRYAVEGLYLSFCPGPSGREQCELDHERYSGFLDKRCR